MRRTNAHGWLLEPMLEEPTYVAGRMFGCAVAYLHGRMVLVLADSDAPWNGVLVPTEFAHHAALQIRFPDLMKHPVLGKWLYISADHDNFENVAQKVVRAILAGDSLIGILPGSKKNKKKGAKGARIVRPAFHEGN